jgi:hypothetical protein
MALSVNYTGFVGVGSWNYYKASAAGSLNTLIFDVRALFCSFCFVLLDCSIYIDSAAWLAHCFRVL